MPKQLAGFKEHILITLRFHKNISRSVYQVLPPSQIISRFDISRYIDFTMHIDITYIEMHSKNYALEKSKQRLIIWDGGNI